MLRVRRSCLRTVPSRTGEDCSFGVKPGLYLQGMAPRQGRWLHSKHALGIAARLPAVAGRRPSRRKLRSADASRALRAGLARPRLREPRDRQPTRARRRHGEKPRLEHLVQVGREPPHSRGGSSRESARDRHDAPSRLTAGDLARYRLASAEHSNAGDLHTARAESHALRPVSGWRAASLAPAQRHEHRRQERARLRRSIAPVDAVETPGERTVVAVAQQPVRHNARIRAHFDNGAAEVGDLSDRQVYAPWAVL